MTQGHVRFGAEIPQHLFLWWSFLSNFLPGWRVELQDYDPRGYSLNDRGSVNVHFWDSSGQGGKCAAFKI